MAQTNGEVQMVRTARRCGAAVYPPRALPVMTWPLFVVVLVVAVTVACEPELGAPCDPDPTTVRETIEVTEGSNNVVQDVRLDNCSEAFCMASGAQGLDASRPYCTQRCESNRECELSGGSGFACRNVITYGPLACADFEDPAHEQPSKRDESSETPCASDEQCEARGERCFTI